MDGILERDAVDLADHRGAEIFFSAIKDFWNLSERAALDAFARDGILTVVNYHKDVKSLDLWELNPEHQAALEAFGPRDVKIGCSYDTARTADMKYGFIVIDTPQGLYPTGKGVVMAEHFVFVQNIEHLAADDCIVAFYVNKRPYSREDTENYGRDEYADTYNFNKWMEERASFYGTDKPKELAEGTAIAAYQKVFERQGFTVKHTLITPCYDYAEGLPPSFRCAMQLVRK